jgi:hypothetical protein
MMSERCFLGCALLRTAHTLGRALSVDATVFKKYLDRSFYRARAVAGDESDEAGRCGIMNVE